jgi:hypothetical protein
MARGNDFPEVLIAPTRSKTIANIFGSAMFAIAAVFFLLTPDIYARLVGIVGLVVFSAGAAYATLRLVSNAPVLVVNKDGLFDSSGLFAVGWVAWGEIAKIEPRRTYLTRMINITPHDPGAIFARLSPRQRWFVRLKAGMSHAPISIPASFLGTRMDEVAALLSRYHDRFGGRR